MVLAQPCAAARSRGTTNPLRAAAFRPTQFTVARCAEPGYCRDGASNCNDSVLELSGGVRERPNRHDWKSCDLKGSVVQIRPSPLLQTLW